MTSTFSPLVRADNFGGDPNYALPAFGSWATASGNTAGFEPWKANDANLGTLWWCDVSTGCSWTVTFSVPRTFDEVDLHMPSNIVASAVDVFADLNNDGSYSSPSERIYQLTGNTAGSRLIPVPATTAKGVKLAFISMYVGTNPALQELEIYRRDVDGDGLMNGFESAMRYYQDASLPNVPRTLNDAPLQPGGPLENATIAEVRLLNWSGVLDSAVANFTVDHTAQSSLTASLGFRDPATGVWTDRYIWDPGARAPIPRFYVRPTGGAVCCTATVEAVITNGVVASAARFYIDGVQRGKLTDPLGGGLRPPIVWMWDTLPETQAMHTIKILLSDRAGNDVLASAQVRVDNTDPTVDLIAPLDLATVTGNVLADTVATDDYLLKQVEYYVDGVHLKDVTTPSSGNHYTWTWDTWPQVDGSHLFQSRALDSAGNDLWDSATVTVANPPHVAIIDPTASANLRATKTVRARADDPSGIQRVEFWLDGVLKSTDYVPSGNEFTWNFDTVPEADGGHMLMARAYDNYGLYSDHLIGVIVDNTLPTVTLTAPSEGATVGGKGTQEAMMVSVVANAADLNLDEVALFVDGVLQQDGQPPVTGTEYRFFWDTYNAFVDGAHTVEVRAYDRAGNVVTDQVSVQLVNYYKPTVSITSPADGTQVFTSVDILATASDQDSDLVGVEFKFDNLEAFQDDSPPYEFLGWSAAKREDGTYVVSVRAIDQQGLDQTASVSLCVDNVSPFGTCAPGGGGDSPFGVGGGGMDGPGGGPISGAFGLDPLTGRLSISAEFRGMKGTPDLRDIQDWAEANLSIGLADHSAWTGKLVAGNSATMAVDLLKEVFNLTQTEVSNGFLAPNFTSQEIHGFHKWRLVVRDWTSGMSGTLKNFTLTVVDRTDPLVADTDGDGLLDGQEIIVTDLDGNGWKEIDEVTNVKSLPIARDSEGDGLTDDEEQLIHTTQPLEADTDHDGLTDFDEVNEYYKERTIPLNVTVVNEGQRDTAFALPATGFYMYKYVLETKFQRDAGPLMTGTESEWSWLEAENDVFMDSRVRLFKDSAVVDSGSRGRLTSVNYAFPWVFMNDTRFSLTLNSFVQDTVGNHNVTFDLVQESLLDTNTVTVHLSAFEIDRRATDPLNNDTDGDGVIDGDEADLGTLPWMSDSDGDGLFDGWDDANSDGIWQGTEALGERGNPNQGGQGGYGTNPAVQDTDGDGLWDGYTTGFPPLGHRGELSTLTLGTSNDTDGDGLLDGWDDVDGDTVWDVGETKGETGDLLGQGGYGTSPLFRDTDADTIHDGWEVKHGLDPLLAFDGTRDPDFDTLLNNQEFLLDTDLNDADTDDDSLNDALEIQDVLLRTSVDEGGRNSTNYGNSGDWVAYKVGATQRRYPYVDTGVNVADTSPANTDGQFMTFIAELQEGGRFYRHTSDDDLYLWMPGSDTNDADFNGTGDGILEGIYHRFAWTTYLFEDLSKPLAGYWHREVYRGSDPHDNDTDEDGIEDGVEISWSADTDGDGVRNNADPDSDADGINDGTEINWAGNSDGDEYANMIDPDADSATNGGTPDGLEALWNADLDGDGLVNMVDPDNDGDHAPDSVEDSNHDGILDAGESDINLNDTDGDGLWDGWQDRNVNPTFEDWLELGEDTDADGIVDLGETDPALSDTDADGLADNLERQLGTFFHEAEDHKGTGVLVFSDPNAVGGSATYLPTPPNVLYTETKTLSHTQTRYRLLVRARQFTSGTNGALLVQRLDSSAFESITVDSPTFEWFSTPLLEAKIANSAVLTVKDNGASSSVYLDRIALVRVDHYHWGSACGSSPTFTFTFSDAVGGNGTFCYEVPATAYPRQTSFQVTGQWVAGIRTVQPLGTARAYHATASANGFVYVFGGLNAASQKLSSLEKYDPVANAWTTLVSGPNVKTKATMSAIQGELIVTGGDPTWKYVARYNLVTGAWTSDTNNKLLNKRAAHAQVTLAGRVYVIGGHSDASGEPALTSVEELDVWRSTWASSVTSLPVARKYLAAVELNGYIYAIGGASGSSSPTVLSTVVKWKPGDSSWSSVGSLQSPRWRHSAAVIDGKIWVFGGASTSSGSMLSSVEVYDPATNLWSTVTPSLSLARVGLGATTNGDTIYLPGGDQNFPTFQATSKAEAYNVSYPTDVALKIGSDGSSDWTRAGKLDRQVTASYLASPIASFVHGSATDGAGKLIVLGGTDGTSYFGTARSVFPDLLWWESLPAVPALTFRSAAAIWDDTLYMVDWVAGLFRALNLVTYTWSTKAIPPVWPYETTIIAADGQLYLMGGHVGGTQTNAISRYTVATNTWSSLGTMPVAVEGHAAVLVGDNIYVLGGRHAIVGGMENLNSVRIYNTRTGTWSTAPSLSTARSALQAISREGTIYAFGGYEGTAYGGETGTYSAKLEALSTSATAWTSLSNMPTAKAWFASALVGGRIYAVGGKNPGVLSEVSAYNIGTDSWSLTGSTPTPLTYAAAAFAPNLVPALVRVHSGTAGIVKVVLQGGEAWPTPSDPTQADSDGDGLLDGDEVLTHATHPFLRDSEGDRIPDADEVAHGTRPDLADTDRDGLWDGYRDANGNRLFDLPIEVGEDTDLDGIRDADETAVLVSDTDGDGLADGRELLPGFGWFEAEGHLKPGALAYDTYNWDGVNVLDAADGSTVTLTAPATSTYRYSVLAKGVGSTPATFVFSWTVGSTPGSSTGTLYYETSGTPSVKTGYYRWYSAYFTATAGALVTLNAPDGSPNVNLRIDRLLLARSDQVTINTVLQPDLCAGVSCIDFGTSNGGATKAVTITIPAMTDSVPRYVTTAKFKILVTPSGSGPIVRASIAGRTLCAEPSVSGPPGAYLVDYVGEFNKYLIKSGWDGTTSISVPLTFFQHNDCNGGTNIQTVKISDVSVVLDPTGSSPLSVDTDGEGVRDSKEQVNRTNPLGANSDNDVKTQGTETWECTDLRETYAADTFCDPESARGTDPTSMDTDGDAIPDGVDPTPFSADGDSDGIVDGAEKAMGTDPADSDTDKDGLLDGTDIVLASGSQLSGAWVLKGIKYDDIGGGNYKFLGEYPRGTNPLVADTDDDWLKDGDEVKLYGTDPVKADTDGDGMPDGWEVKFNGRSSVVLSPLSATDAGLDADSDGLTNADEYALGLDWCVARKISATDCTWDIVSDGTTDFVLNLADDDKDGIPTADELFYGSDVYVADSGTDLDGDGLTNSDEYTASPRLDYSEPDTDGDGMDDGAEKTYWTVTAPPCPIGGWATCLTTYDVDTDGVADGDEVDGWYIWALVDPSEDEWLETHVFSNPALANSDGDGFPDGTEYLKTNAQADDTDGDGLLDWFPATLGDTPLGNRDDNNVEPEKIPPKLSQIGQVTRLEWSGIFVAHTWLDLTVTATDNGGVAEVHFYFVDKGETHLAMSRGNNAYATTFEIDFWADYSWGYEVEAHAWDLAGNVMKRTAGGGLTYALGKLVAGFLNWLLGPAVGGGTFGFFMGMLVGLFEDLSIFLHLGEIFDAIKQMPQLIGKIIGNPGMIIEMLKGMILGHLTRCNLVSPYGVTDAPPGADPLGWWGERVVKWFWGENDPAAGADAVTFVVACTVGSIIGYLVQQFLIGTGIAKFAKELKSGGKFAELGKKLGDAFKPLKKAADKAVEVAKSVAKKFTRAAGEAADRFLEKIGLGGKADNIAEEIAECVAREGALNSCKFGHVSSKFGPSNANKMYERAGRRARETADDFSVDSQIHVLERHTTRWDPGNFKLKNKFNEAWSDQKILDAVEDVVDNPEKLLPDQVNPNRWNIWAVVDGEDIKVVLDPDIGVVTAYPNIRPP